MVLATQNPIEQEGTYPLPEAQLDRFLFSLYLDYPSFAEEMAIVKKHSAKIDATINSVVSQENILQLQDQVYSMSVSEHIFEKAVRLTRATRPSAENPVAETRQFVKWGAGPRAVQFLVLAAKARALLRGRPTPIEEDIVSLFKPAMNHRIQLNFQAEAEGVTMDSFLDAVLKKA